MMAGAGVMRGAEGTSGRVLSSEDECGHAIRFKDVTFGYGNGSPVFEDFSLQVDPGTFFCLVGPSGCGKTTLLNMVAGFERAVRGVVEIEGKQIVGPSVERPAVFQGDQSIFPWLTAEDNVALALRYQGVSRKDRRARAREVMKVMGLAGHEGKFPRQLSGGMKQRIQIARAFVTNAPVLLMDEPFAAVDAQVRSILQDELLRIWATTRPTVLFITHDITEAILLGDQVGAMSSGPRATLKTVKPVRGRRPRVVGGEEFQSLYEDLFGLIKEEVVSLIASDRGVS